MTNSDDIPGEVPDTASSPIVPSVLLVDDHAPNLLALEAVLEPLQVRMVRAASGRDAIEHLLREDFAAIVLDVQMPELDGFETAAIIRQRDRNRETPILFLTALHHDESYQTRGYSYGAVDYLTKPFNPVALRAKVSALVELWRRGEELRRREAALHARERASLVAREQAARAQAQVLARDLDAQYRLNRTITDSATAALFMINEQRRCTFMNPAAEAMTGYTFAQVQAMDRPLHDIVHHTRADGSPYPLSDCPIEAAQSRGARETGEDVFVRPDGRSYPVVFTTSPIVQETGSLDMLLEVRDSTEEKRASATADFLARTSTLLGTSLDIQQTLQNVTGLVVPERADGCLVYLAQEPGRYELAALSHIDPERAEALRECDRVHPISLSDLHGHATVIRADREDAHRAVLAQLEATSVIMAPLRVHERTLGVLVLAMVRSERSLGAGDVTWIEELARRVAIAIDNAQLFALSQHERQCAEEANRAKDEFLSVASHELRTPLTAIQGWSQMLRTGMLSEEKRNRALETIERNAALQVQLIEDILDVSNIITGRLRLDITPVDLRPIVDATVEIVRPAMEARNVHLSVEIDPTVGIIQGDAMRLQQILWNLLANAVKFTPKGGSVTVRLTPQESQLKLVVSDTGQGIERVFLPLVFLPFKQADASVTRQHGGLGLGLAIVKHLVELHGGSIEAHSEGRGTGAMFTLYFPMTA